MGFGAGECDKDTTALQCNGFLKYTKREEMQQSYEQVHWPYFDFMRRVT